MYVAVKGGEQAIAAAHKLLAHERRGDPAVPEITPDQIREQLSLAVDRVMAEGSLYDRDLAALAIKQARGDLIEAIFLVRAYRTTLPRFGYAEPLDSEAMNVRRRVSATFKDLPGGQILGPTFDYMHRLIDPSLAVPTAPKAPARTDPVASTAIPRVMSLLDREGLVERNVTPEPGEVPADLTRDAISFPAGRDLRLQSLARGDEGFLLALGYSTQRGYGRTHAFAGEIRMGEVEIEFVPEELGFAVPLGLVSLTECEMVTQFKGSATQAPQFTRGYGLVFGQSERKAMSMALVDRALRTRELGEEVKAPAQDEEFVLSHSDSVQATGFVEHLKLPHYVDFQSELALVRTLRAEHDAREAARAALRPDTQDTPRKEAAE
jgi:alpha-D-ribose 1-methylphosphonate 5-triphosphate synthase subunit PhnI